MPELRRDPVSGRLVLVAAERGARPHTVAPDAEGATSSSECPFCPGHEAMTPPEVYRTGSGTADSTGWNVRVVPNLYPMVGGEHAGPGAAGAHEVVILSPAHDASFGRLDDAQAVDMLTVLRDRSSFHLRGGRRFVQVLVNHRRAGGASIAHPHAQLVALDFVPPDVEADLARWKDAGHDLAADDLRSARDLGLLVIDGAAPVWSPAAMGFPYGLRVGAPTPRACFDKASDDDIVASAIALRDALAALDQVLGDPPYNVVVHSAPPEGDAGPFSWYVDLLPRIGVLAGFELGTGVLVNVVPPEQAATDLRGAITP